MSIHTKYHAIIIGSGQAGNPLARYLANKGLRVAVIENDRVGGTCVNWGCTPTKTLYASARIAHIAKRASEYGIHVSLEGINFQEIMLRKDGVVKIWHDGGVKSLESSPNIDLFSGEGSFVNQNSVQVKKNTGELIFIQSDTIFINTGARAYILSIPGLESIEYLDNKKILSLSILPRHLIIIGGGYIAVEFGQMFHRFGSEVTLIVRGSSLLSREDSDVSEAVAEVLQKEGIKILFHSQISEIIKISEDNYCFKINTKGENQKLEGSHLLLATGRVPNSDTLNLASAGVETDANGYIVTNEKLQTNIKSIFALGDVKGGPAFTHISYDDYRIIRDTLYEGKQRNIFDRSIPNTVFIDPQLGSVGLNETEAKKRNIPYDLYKMQMSYVARAYEMSETQGFMKVLVEPVSQTILGATIFGFEGGELMAMLQIAMENKMTIDKLRDDVFAHPTLAEGFNNLFTYYKV